MTLANIEWYALTDQGNIRKNNEDVWASDPENGFFLIADGMGGHQAGEIAAQNTTDFISQLLKKPPIHLLKTFTSRKKSIISFLSQSIEKTNQYIYQLGITNEQFKGMGTTLCCLYIQHKTAYLAHVGDSRIYLFRNYTLKQLTNDHSLTNKLWQQIKHIKRDFSSYKHIITRAIGTTAHITPDITTLKYFNEDVFFLCTDGLSDYVPGEMIQNILSHYSSSLELPAKKLIETAKKYGSPDNITVLLLKIKSKR